MSKIDLVSGEWTDLVFEGKNQAYGAYQLRKGTTKRNIISIVAVIILAILIFAGLALKKMADERAAKFDVTEVNQLSQLNQPKEEAKVEQKVKPKVQEQEQVVEKVKSSIKFTPPVIKKDAEVKPEEEIKTQNELMNTKTAIGSFNVKGNDEDGGTVLKAKEVIAQPEPPKHVEENKVFDIVEQMPSFPGGPAELMKWLGSHVQYPAIAQENGVQGRVIVAFVVEKDGSVTDVTVVRSVDPSLDKEAARVVRQMPKWIPGKQNGAAVRVKYNVPVTFKLQ
ncbi:energy transducer TonB [Hoylesella nanceiensis]|uniref:energy transducer TonB n=1 Tax=Hoylesella nanceiensis TaxID=425941 RepID=UPI001CB3E258|nr:energy transducer TonB [Hoylesella nanceiensis]MBF1420072.1 energy transducer TonB [Hoylesella nanceiensis]MBF1454279.1 energy transducer TonB [Hoylesella nanceiensis]